MEQYSWCTFPIFGNTAEMLWTLDKNAGSGVFWHMNVLSNLVCSSWCFSYDGQRKEEISHALLDVNTNRALPKLCLGLPIQGLSVLGFLQDCMKPILHVTYLNGNYAMPIVLFSPKLSLSGACHFCLVCNGFVI